MGRGRCQSCSSPCPAAQVSHELADSCCQSVHTYIHAQQMLAALAARPEGAAFRRASQELQLQAARVSAAAHRNNISPFILDVGRPAWPLPS
jgi:hypothetical protein